MSELRVDGERREVERGRGMQREEGVVGCVNMTAAVLDIRNSLTNHVHHIKDRTSGLLPSWWKEVKIKRATSDSHILSNNT